MLNKSGIPVYLPYELTTPFLRHICRRRVNNIKRYTISNVYIKRSDEVHPEQVAECNYDIVYENSYKQYIYILYIYIIHRNNEYVKYSTFVDLLQTSTLFMSKILNMNNRFLFRFSHVDV